MNRQRILIPIFLCGLLMLDYGLIYGQDDHLTVKGITKANTITFSGNMTVEPLAPLKGEIFYNSSTKVIKYFNGTKWSDIGAAGPKTVGAKIVAAADTPEGGRRADIFCDGSNDQVEIQSAIDALGTKGGAVYLLEGTYNISSSINLNKSKASLIGTGRGVVLKIASGASNVNVINASNVNRIFISQLTIDGNNTTGSANNGIYFNWVTYSKIDKVWVESIDGQGIYFANSSHNSVSDSNAQSNTSSGISFSSSSNNTVSGNNMQSNTSFGISFSSSSNNIVADNNIKDTSEYGIWISGSNYNLVYGNMFKDVVNSIYLRATSTANIISNNNVQGNYGLYIADTASSDNIITANMISAGNGNYDGLQLVSSNNLISSNSIFTSGGTGYGINISSASANNNYLVGNLIYGFSSDKMISDSGTNTKYTDRTKLTLEQKLVSWDPEDGEEMPQESYLLNSAGLSGSGDFSSDSRGHIVIFESSANDTSTWILGWLGWLCMGYANN